jgi:hypothetical protein
MGGSEIRPYHVPFLMNLKFLSLTDGATQARQIFEKVRLKSVS